VFAELASIAVGGGIEPLVADTYPLAEIAAAQERFVAGDFVGKLVLVP
jgi:NADPH:quinone reductase-like Zn-dependent oxidoreductase